jgi:hypothetical protein
MEYPENQTIKPAQRRIKIMPRNNNKPAVQGAKNVLDNMKYEMAGELGIANYNNIDKGNLSSRQNGYVGGYMTRKLVQFAEEQLKGNNP